MTREWKFKNAFKCNKCPQRNDVEGCPDWWEFAGANGQITKGCGRHQDIKLPFYVMILNEAHCAAASADKATNYAATAENASMAAMSLMLGVVGGEIAPPRLEGPSNGDTKILTAAGPVD